MNSKDKEPLIKIRGNPERVKKFLQSKHGYYLQGFKTTINQATNLEIKQTPIYAKQLVGRFHDLNPKLIGLYRVNADSDITSFNYQYIVGMGQVVIGKMNVKVQEVNDEVTIRYIYQYKVSSSEYRREATTMKRRDNSNSYKNFRGNARKWRKYRHNRE